MKSTAIMIALLLAGCVKNQPASPVPPVDIGTITDASIVSTSFNECQKTQVKTTGRMLVVVGILSVPFGVHAQIVMHDGREFLTWDGANSDYLIFSR